ncbi:hypothetical protein N7510_009325 [Penicillium lagena]|uniref:uncharacterized protein n=1 Tax=Penicillium lagena TaxID=94218 RepID=UPI0025416854|nr:uncharacterized protein N7510_009325 [Penicillium lagena]KAJ5606544.1 hypothetical protein N7510_009325 [Penicillium lagena]
MGILMDDDIHAPTVASGPTWAAIIPSTSLQVAETFYTVRTTRVRIIHLRNDHKEVMTYLEKGLHAHFASLQNAQTTTPTPNGTSVPATIQAPSGTSVADAGAPFAKVNSVVSGSPADQAGLKAGDTIRSFGNVHWMNHERLSKVAEVVQQSEGVGTHTLSDRKPVLTVCAASVVRQGGSKGRERVWDYDGAGSPARSPARLGWAWSARLPSSSVVRRHGLGSAQNGFSSLLVMKNMML